MKDWDKGTLTEKERGDLAKAQDIEEKLQLTKYLSPQENQGLKDAISLKFDGIALPSTLNFDNLGKNKSKPNIILYILIIVVVAILYKLFQK